MGKMDNLIKYSFSWLLSPEHGDHKIQFDEHPADIILCFGFNVKRK